MIISASNDSTILQRLEANSSLQPASQKRAWLRRLERSAGVLTTRHEPECGCSKTPNSASLRETALNRTTRWAGLPQESRRPRRCAPVIVQTTVHGPCQRRHHPRRCASPPRSGAAPLRGFSHGEQFQASIHFRTYFAPPTLLRLLAARSIAVQASIALVKTRGHIANQRQSGQLRVIL